MCGENLLSKLRFRGNAFGQLFDPTRGASEKESP